MKKVISILAFLIVGLFIVSCNKKVEEVTHQEVFDAVLIGYQSGDSSAHVTQDIQLPSTTSFDGVTLTWVSANENLISSSGRVNRPSAQDVQVLLILEVIIGGVSEEKNFLLTVIATDPVVEDVFYTVTFNTNGGSDVTSLSIKENGLINEPNDPSKTGFIFDGWFKDSDLSIPWSFTGDTVTSNVTLYAKWLPDGAQYTVTFQANGGSDVEAQTVNENAKVNKPADPTKADYEFDGWYQDEALTIPWGFDADTVSGDMTLYAKWTPIITYFEVQFDTNGGSEIEPVAVEENTLILEPDAPVRERYIFDGWYQDELLTMPWDFDNDLLTGDVTLYASWYPEGIEPESSIYIVSFETDGGPKIASEFVAENHPIDHLSNPVRNDYDFEGWFQDEELTLAWNAENVVTGNITLYAKWHQLPPKLPAPILTIGHQPRPVGHIALGPYAFVEGENGGYTGYGLVFTNLTTNEVFIWRKANAYKAGFATYYNESDLAPAGIVLTPGEYKLTYFAMGNGVTTRDSDVSYQTVDFTIEKPQLSQPLLTIDQSNKQLIWGNVANATSYEVYIDNELQTGNTSPFDLSGLTETGLYVIKVVAKADTHRPNEATIEYAVADLEAPKLTVPANISINGFMLTWDAVENAVGYTITINDVTKQSTTNSLNLTQFGIGNQEVTIKIVALGNSVDYSDSNEAEFICTLPELLAQLNSIATSNFVSGYLLNGVDGGYRKLEIYKTNPPGNPFTQSGWNGFIRIGIKVNGQMLYQDYDFRNVTMQMIHTPGSTTDFFGKNLPQSGTVEIHLILLGDGINNRDSKPLILSMNWTR